MSNTRIWVAIGVEYALLSPLWMIQSYRRSSRKTNVKRRLLVKDADGIPFWHIVRGQILVGWHDSKGVVLSGDHADDESS